LPRVNVLLFAATIIVLHSMFLLCKSVNLSLF
jgi:hypothetical protein